GPGSGGGAPAAEARAGGRPAQRAAPADDDDGEGFDDDLDRHVERGGRGGNDQRARGGAEHRPEREYRGIDAPHVDAERLGHGAIFRGGAQDAAEIRPLQERAQPERSGDRRGDEQEVVDGNAEIAGGDGGVDQVGADELYG